MQMSFAAGILELSVWLCPNEVSVKWVSIIPDLTLRGKTQRDREDNYNELRLEISQFRYADKNLVISCDNLKSRTLSGPMLQLF